MDVDRLEARPHEQEVAHEPSGPAVRVHKGVNALELEVEQRRRDGGVPFRFGTRGDKVAHALADVDGGRRLEVGAGDLDLDVTQLKRRSSFQQSQ